MEVIGRGDGQGITADDIWAVFQQHGVKAKKNYVFNITSRLTRTKRVEKRGDRYYTYKRGQYNAHGAPMIRRRPPLPC
jgi:hypothetical protein